MRSILKAPTLALAFCAPLVAEPAFASDVANVNVALLDASSAMANGVMGMMAPKPGYWGGGMMGDRGRGMMSQGQGHWGSGMMGGGMMGTGMMSIRTDQASVKTGKVHFTVTNRSKAVAHEMLVVAVEDPNASLPYDDGAAIIPEGQINVLGEVDKLGANETESLELDLPPGTYLLVCNVPGHYASGMLAQLTVAP